MINKIRRILFTDEELWTKSRIEDRSSTELIVLVRGRKGSELYPVLKDTSDIGFDFPPAPSIEWTYNIITKILTTQETIPNKYRYFEGIDLLRAVMFDYVVGVHALLETAGRMATIIKHIQPERVESIGLNWDVQMLLIKLSRLFGIPFCKENLLYRSVKTMSLIQSYIRQSSESVLDLQESEKKSEVSEEKKADKNRLILLICERSRQEFLASVVRNALAKHCQANVVDVGMGFPFVKDTKTLVIRRAKILFLERIIRQTFKAHLQHEIGPVQYVTFNFSASLLARSLVHAKLITPILRSFNIRNHISLVITTTPHWISSALMTELCTQLNIPSIYLQGYTLSAEAWYSLLRQTKIAVFGEVSRKALINSGTDPNRIVVTGPLQFDHLTTIDPTVREHTRSIVSCPNKTPLVCVTTQQASYFRSQEEGELILVEIGKAIKELKELYFVIKIHPSESLDRYQEVFNAEKYPNCIVYKDLNIYTLLYSCDLLITEPTSQTALEAIVLRRPVITINLTRRADVMDYAEQGAAFPVREQDELISAIRRMVSGLDQEPFIQNMEKYLRISACGADGKAAERFADLVDTLI